MTTTLDATVYSTSTDAAPVLGDISDALRDQIGIFADGSDSYFSADESDYSDEYCFVCARATDHRSEHDDLVEQGKARYDRSNGIVYYDALGGFAS